MEFNELIEALPGFNVTSTANAAALVAVTFKTGESGYMGPCAFFLV